MDVGDGAQDNWSFGSHSSASLNKTASNKPLGTMRGGRPVGKDKPPPKCFICSHPDSKHFLADCETFDRLSLHEKRQRVVDAKRCLNCLSLDHFVRECPRPSKCCECGPNCRTKHATALHECYNKVNLGAVDASNAPIPAPRNRAGSSCRNFSVRKLNTSNNHAILLMTIAVKVLNPETGMSTLAYAQHNTGSQVTLISENLKQELGLQTTPDLTVTICTLADQKINSEGRTTFKLESLYNGDEFLIEDALVPRFFDDQATLPHKVDTSGLPHFDGVYIPEAPQRERVHVLTGQSDKSLLIVLEEREGAHPEEPNYVLTRLGPVASGGTVPVESNFFASFRVNVEALPVTNC